MNDAFGELERKIAKLTLELTNAKAATNLQAVQNKLDAFMDEIRLLHRGFLSTLEEMIAGLNAEGVKRYEGAVKQVNDNANLQLSEIKAEIKKVLAKLEYM